MYRSLFLQMLLRNVLKLYLYQWASVPMAGPKIIFKRIYKSFSEDEFIKDLSKITWNSVLDVENSGAALCKFMDLFMYACDKHAPIKKLL